MTMKAKMSKNADELSPERRARALRFSKYYDKVIREDDPRLKANARQMWDIFMRQANELAIWDVCPSQQAIVFYFGVTMMMCSTKVPPPIGHAHADNVEPPDGLDQDKVTLLTVGMMLGMYLEELGMAHFLTRSNEPNPPEVKRD